MKTMPTPLDVMKEITGTKEVAGSGDNPVILSWEDEIGTRFPDMESYCNLYRHDEIAWCGLTVAYCMARCGIRPIFGPTDTDKFLWAEAWKQFGTELDGPEVGCVVVFSRHVALVDKIEGKRIHVRGGNQSDAVNVAIRDTASALAFRRAPQPEEAEGLFTGITATIFGTVEDGLAQQRTAYSDVAAGWPNRPGVALPARFSGIRPRVNVVYQGRSVLCDIVDVGPWNTKDPYWDKGTRPQAESGKDKSGRKTNSAGIDLTPAAAKVIGLPGKGKVSWSFEGKGRPMAETTSQANLERLLAELLTTMQRPAQTEKKPSFFERIFGVFKSPANASAGAGAGGIALFPILQQLGMIGGMESGSGSILLTLAGTAAGLGLFGRFSTLVSVAIEALQAFKARQAKVQAEEDEG